MAGVQLEEAVSPDVLLFQSCFLLSAGLLDVLEVWDVAGEMAAMQSNCGFRMVPGARARCCATACFSPSAKSSCHLAGLGTRGREALLLPLG